MSVLSVMRNLRAKVDAGHIRPHCFVEVNGLKLVSPENIYRVMKVLIWLDCNLDYYLWCFIFFQVIYEALTGHRVNWKKALQLLTKRFSDVKNCQEDDRPCILLIDELDLLVTRNQSVSVTLSNACWIERLLHSQSLIVIWWCLFNTVATWFLIFLFFS